MHVPIMKQTQRHLVSQNDFNSSVRRALLILESFTTRQPRLSLSEIHRVTNIPKSTVFRLVGALAGLNYLKYDAEGKKFFLGPKVLSLGFTVLRNLEDREIARPYMQSLVREINLTVGLLMLEKAEMVFIEKIRVPTLRDINIGIGSRLPVYNTAAGRVVLAHLSPEKLQAVVGEIKNDSSAAQYMRKNGKSLLASLAEVRRRGYATNDEESMEGIRALAVPIFSADGVAYAMHLVVTPEQIAVDRLVREYAPKLIATGREISEALGYHG
jgi:DNA-binding IclR family transcriptional regulator